MTEATAPEVSTVLSIELPGLPGARSFDCTTIPAHTRLDMLKSAVAGYIRNRVNQTSVRHGKDEKVAAWTAYDEAQKADPMQTAVAKPEGERPAAPDLEASYSAAIAALTSGDIRKLGTGAPKSRSTVDPLVKAVTDIVVKEVFAARKAADATYTFLKAKAEVGSDGIKYLSDMIEAKVAAAPEADQVTLRAQLEKMREAKYVGPAKIMLGMTVSKALSELPSIL